MRVTVDRKSFLDSFTAVAGAVPSKAIKAVLKSVLFTTSEDGSELLATDYEIGVRQRVLGVRVDVPGSCLLPAAKISQWLKSVTTPEVTIETGGIVSSINGATVGTEIVITSFTSELAIPSDDPAMFPDVPAFDSDSYAIVTAADLKRAIQQTISVIEISEMKGFALAGALFEFGAGDVLHCVSTNGNRLAHSPIGFERFEGWNPLANVIVPEKALGVLARLLDDDDPPVHLALVGEGAKGTGIVFRTERASLYSRLIEGRFPSWRGFLPSPTEGVIVPFLASDLLSGVEQAAVTTSEITTSVDMVFSPSKLTIRSQSADVGRSRVDVPHKFEGAVPDICLAPKHLVIGLKTIDPSAEIACHVIDNSRPIVLRHGSWEYAVATINIPT